MTIHQRTTFGLFVLALLLPASGCDGTGPRDLSREELIGTWELASIDGQPLPTSVPPWASFSSSELISASLVLSEGEVDWLRYCEVVVYQGSAPYMHSRNEHLTWQVAGPAATISFMHGGGAHSAVRATLEGTALIVERTFENPTRTFRFEKVSDIPLVLPSCRY
jgi:hypothetical protein